MEAAQPESILTELRDHRAILVRIVAITATRRDRFTKQVSRMRSTVKLIDKILGDSQLQAVLEMDEVDLSTIERLAVLVNEMLIRKSSRSHPPQQKPVKLSRKRKTRKKKTTQKSVSAKPPTAPATSGQTEPVKGKKKTNRIGITPIALTISRGNFGQGKTPGDTLPQAMQNTYGEGWSSKNFTLNTAKSSMRSFAENLEIALENPDLPRTGHLSAAIKELVTEGGWKIEDIKTHVLKWIS